LAEPDCQRRLSELSDDQVREVSTRLQKLKPEIARAGSPEELRRLAMIWKKGKLYD
jgi:cytochrome c553